MSKNISKKNEDRLKQYLYSQEKKPAVSEKPPTQHTKEGKGKKL